MHGDVLSTLGHLERAKTTHQPTWSNLALRWESRATFVGRQVAARGERTASQAPTRGRGTTAETDHLTLGRHVGGGGSQVPSVRMAGIEEQFGSGTQLDDSTGVHDRNPIGKVGNDRKIVGDVQRGDLVCSAQLTNCFQNVSLCADIESGRRLVEHDHRRAAGKRHGQPDSLLLPTAELMRISPQELRRADEEHLRHHLGDTGAPCFVTTPEVVCFQDLHDLLADAECRIERR